MRKIFIVLFIISCVFIITFKSLYKPQLPIQDTEHNKIVKKVNSPNGNKTAIVFERDFGATTDFNTQVSILKESDNFYDEPGNTFIATHNKVIDIKWKDDKTLTVSYSCDENDVFLKNVTIKGTDIAYSKLETIIK